MIKFGQYPVFINHPGYWEEERQRQIEEFAEKGDWQMVRWLRGTAKDLYATMSGGKATPEGSRYERDIHGLLIRIAATRVGRLLLESLDRSQRYWVVPLDEEHEKIFGPGAATFPFRPKAGGGVRIFLNPADFRKNGRMWNDADDVLFHELVHAYRLGRVGWSGRIVQAMNDYDHAEEFVALQLQNIYLADRGSFRFYLNYRTLQSVSKGTAYRSYSSDMEALMAFRYFLDNEPLAGAIARRQERVDTFNPWRDLPILERMFTSSVAIPKMPSFLLTGD